MKISTKGRYALAVMVDLGLNNNGNFISLKDIATRQGISAKYLEQIVSLLNKAGYLQTARGNTGGYKLKKAPSEYKIGDILRATEGDLKSIVCLTDKGACDKISRCKTYSFWKGLDDAINDYINSKTLEDLIK